MLLKSHDDRLKTNKTYFYFCLVQPHLSILFQPTTSLICQEFFTAIHIVFFLPEEKRHDIFPDLKKSKLEVVANFVFGLIDEKMQVTSLRCSDFPKQILLRKTKLVALAKYVV